MKYKAIFFDRDGTLTYFNPEKEAWRNKKVALLEILPSYNIPTNK